MKVQIKNLESNPYRDMENYPISEEKVQRLAESINQTGFWDNILARKQNGKIQIAYGHHRLVALRKVMKPTDEVDVPVKSLDDATMIKIMANENMDEWKTDPGVIDETVRVAKRFLDEHPEEAKKAEQQLLNHGLKEGYSKENQIIATFLGWLNFRVRDSVNTITGIDDGIIEQEAVRNLPTERSRRDFVKAVKQLKPTPVQQKKAATKISEMAKGERGETAVRNVIIDEMLPSKENKDQKLKDFSEVIAKVAKLISQLSGELDTIIEYKAEFNSPIYRKTFERFSFEANKSRLLKKFNTLDEEIYNEKFALEKH